MSLHTIHLSDARFAELQQAARAQGKTPDELADEAIAMLVRRDRLEGLLTFGEQQSRRLGVTEQDVERLINEARNERRK